MKLTAASLLVLAGCASSVQPAFGPESGYLWPTAPDFVSPTVTGSEVALAELRGRIVLLHFWARPGNTCEADLEAFQSLREKYSGADIAIIGLAHASGVDEEVALFTRDLGVEFPNVQATEELCAAYNANVFPTTLILDRQGRVRDRGNARLDPEYWDRRIAELLAEQ